MRWIAVLVSCAILAGRSSPARSSRRSGAKFPTMPFSRPAATRTSCTRSPSQFASTEWRFWNTDLRIVAFERVREDGLAAVGARHDPAPVLLRRRLVSDGRRRRIEYSVREGLSFIGVTWGTEWCISGLDRHYAYAPHCRQAQP